MHRHLFALILLIAGLGIAPTAKAQIPVIDSANLAQNVQELAQDVATVEQLKNQLTQLQNTYSMFTTPTNVLGMAPGLESPALENPMPAVNAVAGLLDGQTSPTGAGATYYTQNHIYTPTGTSSYNTQLNANAQGIASIEGVASNNLSAIQARLEDLPNLESDLQSATSITQFDAINGRIEAEAQFVQAQQAQATNLQVLASEQQASEQQQQQERFHEDAANYVNTMKQAAAANGGQ